MTFHSSSARGWHARSLHQSAACTHKAPVNTHRRSCSNDLEAHPCQTNLVQRVETGCGAHLPDAPGDGVEGDALLGHAPVGLGHQLDQRVQRDLQPRDVLNNGELLHAAAACPPCYVSSERPLSSITTCDMQETQTYSSDAAQTLHIVKAHCGAWYAHDRFIEVSRAFKGVLVK